MWSTRPGSASSDARKPRSVEAASRSPTSAWRISSATASSSGAIPVTRSSAASAWAACSEAPVTSPSGTSSSAASAGRGREIGDVAQPLALGLQPLLVAGAEPGRALDQLGQLRQMRLPPRRRLGQLVAAAARGGQLLPGPGVLGAAAQLLLAGERVEDVELVGGAGKTALLELARHGDQPLDERGQLLARDAAAPGVGARAPVGEDPPRGDQTRFLCGLELGDRGEVGIVEDPVGEVELGLDVRLLRSRSEVAGVAPGAEEQAERLGEDRLPRPGLARDRVQAGRHRELGVADEHEVLDAEAAEGYEKTSL